MVLQKRRRQTPVRLLVIDDSSSVRDFLRANLTALGHQVETASDGAAGLLLFSQARFDVTLLDLKMPGMSGVEVLREMLARDPEAQVIIVSGAGEVDAATECLKMGAYDYLSKPFHLTELDTLVGLAADERRRRTDATAAPAPAGFEDAVGTSPGWSAAVELACKIAPSNASVLINGPSGAGKEVIARAIHQMSGRADQPMMAVNCRAFTDALLESELFGHEKGAYTGADSERAGIFEVGYGGTLFLDEVLEMSPAMQSKLLRVLELGEFRRVGSSRVLKTNVRVIAASNREPRAEISAGRFREDLYYRIATITVELPPLRERREDIPLLIRHFVAQLSPERNIRIDPMAMASMLAYEWPGNVRELRNVIERALLISENGVITLQHLAPIIAPVPKQPQLVKHETEIITLRESEQRLIAQALKRTRGNRAAAARLLGIDPRTLRDKLRSMHGVGDVGGGEAQGPLAARAAAENS